MTENDRYAVLACKMAGEKCGQVVSDVIGNTAIKTWSKISMIFCAVTTFVMSFFCGLSGDSDL
jgi:hypothetical protein